MGNGNRSCSKIHIHKGENEKMIIWNLLQKNLSSISNQNYFIKFNIPYKCHLCPSTTIEFDKKKHIIFEEKIEIDTEVNTLDPIKAWKIRTVDIQFETKNGRFTHKVKEQLKKKNIPTYSTILKINDSKCDIMQNKCSDGRGFSNLRNTHTLLIGYHENKNKIWVIEKGDHDKTWIIIFATLLIVMVIMAIVYRCWCVPKKHTHKKKNTNIDDERKNSTSQL